MRSAGAVHVLEVYPPWGLPMHDTGDNLLALAYPSWFALVLTALPCAWLGGVLHRNRVETLLQQAS
jgi:hypothetical protein